MLPPLRYKNYTWPVNPAIYSMNYEKNTAIHYYPYTSYNEIEDIGTKPREITGTGEFIGKGAYEEFGKLATVFYDPGPGALIHPIWQIQQAVFAKLQVEQEPTPNYVKYSFTFLEHNRQNEIQEMKETMIVSNTPDNKALIIEKIKKVDNKIYVVKKGECLTAIAKRNGTTWQSIAKKNPSIKNPNLIRPGQKLVI